VEARPPTAGPGKPRKRTRASSPPETLENRGLPGRVAGAAGHRHGSCSRGWGPERRLSFGRKGAPRFGRGSSPVLATGGVACVHAKRTGTIGVAFGRRRTGRRGPADEEVQHARKRQNRPERRRPADRPTTGTLRRRRDDLDGEPAPAAGTTRRSRARPRVGWRPWPGRRRRSGAPGRRRARSRARLAMARRRGGRGSGSGVGRDPAFRHLETRCGRRWESPSPARRRMDEA
jgi:hypothetical protein